VNPLEQKIQAMSDKPVGTPSGMTAEQVQDFNRIAIKTEAQETTSSAAW
jgi:hypothetical protein